MYFGNFSIARKKAYFRSALKLFKKAPTRSYSYQYARRTESKSLRKRVGCRDSHGCLFLDSTVSSSSIQLILGLEISKSSTTIVGVSFLLSGALSRLWWKSANFERLSSMNSLSFSLNDVHRFREILSEGKVATRSVVGNSSSSSNLSVELVDYIICQYFLICFFKLLNWFIIN